MDLETDAIHTALLKPDGQPLQHEPALGRRIWNKWLKVAEVIGTVQMLIILSIMYLLILPFMAIPFRIFADPLRVRHRPESNWRVRKDDESLSILDSMGDQF